MQIFVAVPLILVMPYMSIIKVEAEKNQLDPLLVAAVIYKESKFCNKSCYRGSHGLMQIQLKSRSCKKSMIEAKAQGLYDPKTNIEKGVKLLVWWRGWWRKHYGHADFHWLSFYNQGFGKCPRNKRRCKLRERTPVRTGKIGGYADRVLCIYRELKRRFRSNV